MPNLSVIRADLEKIIGDDAAKAIAAVATGKDETGLELALAVRTFQAAAADCLKAYDRTIAAAEAFVRVQRDGRAALRGRLLDAACLVTAMPREGAR